MNIVIRGIIILGFVLSSLGCEFMSVVGQRAEREKATNEAEVCMKNIRAAEETFLKKNNRFGTLIELSDAGLFSSTKYSILNSDYALKIDLKDQTPSRYEASLTPLIKKGELYPTSYFVDETNVIRVNYRGKPADKTCDSISEPSDR